jgi:hypothetical protein
VALSFADRMSAATRAAMATAAPGA